MRAGFWSDDHEIGAERRRHDPGGMDDASNRAHVHGCGLDGTTDSRVDYLRRGRTARSGDRHEGRDARAGRQVMRLIGVAHRPPFEIGDRRLIVRRGLQRAETRVARHLQSLQEGGDACLAEPVGILGHALDLERRRKNLVPVPQILLPLCVGARHGGSDLAPNAREYGLTRGRELNEGGLFHAHAGGMPREQGYTNQQRRPAIPVLNSGSAPRVIANSGITSGILSACASAILARCSWSWLSSTASSTFVDCASASTDVG